MCDVSFQQIHCSTYHNLVSIWFDDCLKARNTFKEIGLRLIVNDAICTPSLHRHRSSRSVTRKAIILFRRRALLLDIPFEAGANEKESTSSRVEKCTGINGYCNKNTSSNWLTLALSYDSTYIAVSISLIIKLIQTMDGVCGVIRIRLHFVFCYFRTPCFVISSYAHTYIHCISTYKEFSQCFCFYLYLFCLLVPPFKSQHRIIDFGCGTKATKIKIIQQQQEQTTKKAAKSSEGEKSHNFPTLIVSTSSTARKLADESHS